MILHLKFLDTFQKQQQLHDNHDILQNLIQINRI